ncbi:MAG: tol-pal system-associated acyl-CoA thioesterase [Ferrovibrio sp.]|uniref:tol-pal system-associated acyl-CoA thioesterase n=1 Tax=Ferrovibrio sp. TaxID=1917215 RepID=UPI002623FCE3|nr:tol-pal system-associated acyl-CoA thioesterase [Ferrovibrio sp.]MCW0236147.1 tol-pal system-associated acyl-CoA thioesterase [Ferrovibrio sp.]
MPRQEDAVHRYPPHRYPLRVQWEDTDAAGIVYYANYLRFIERGRSDLLLSHGIDQRGLIDSENGVAFAVRACNVEYLKPARLHEELTVTTAITELRGASLTARQDVWRGEELLVRAEVKLACIDAKGRARRVPPAVAALFATLSPNLSH